jgi:hypothetical protein
VLKCLARSVSDAGNRPAIAEQGAIPHLVRLVADAHSGNKAQQSAAAAIWNISNHVPNRAIAIRAGAIPALVRLLSSSSDVTLRDTILGALARLTLEDHSEMEVAAAGGIPILLDILSNGEMTLHEKAGERWRRAGAGRICSRCLLIAF